MEVLICKGHHWFARLIMRVLGYPWSHCAFRYASPEDRWIVHSTLGGVQPEWWNFFRPKYDQMRRFRSKIPLSELALDAIVEEIGHKQYDYLGIVGFFIVLQLRRLGFKISKNPLGQENQFMCTEVFVKWFKKCAELNGPTYDFSRIGVDLEQAFVEDLTDPHHILEFMEKSSWFEEIHEAA